MAAKAKPSKTAKAKTAVKKGGNAFTRKFGPLPAWAWLLGVGAGIYLWRKHEAASSTSPATTAASAPSGGGFGGGFGGGGDSGDASGGGAGTPTPTPTPIPAVVGGIVGATTATTGASKTAVSSNTPATGAPGAARAFLPTVQAKQIGAAVTAKKAPTAKTNDAAFAHVLATADAKKTSAKTTSKATPKPVAKPVATPHRTARNVKAG